MRVLLLGALVFLAACGQTLTPEEKAASDARDIAMVKKAQEQAKPPLQAIVPDPISWADMEENDIAGASCKYAPGTSLGTRVIAMPEVAYVKLNGKLVRLARDIGAQKLPLDTWSQYDGKSYSLKLSISGDGRSAEDGTTSYDGSVILKDPYNRIVYDGSGLAQCGS
ncbi:hypothetical protein GRI39_03765 [Altererythrobacter indicus]|uniref:Lipoprotein n=1 Tax=Altericroceibacterium indicum TaxID=374177 RepID=A0A845A4N6_9SPHN|nr:hypothetical protein [Altericroceibacterium indicum]MXP25160.1 hypothetical protein [Altericroceibacterium indicum]